MSHNCERDALKTIFIATFAIVKTFKELVKAAPVVAKEEKDAI
jgi:hypothetical protein